jgi:hypothetical protein
MKSYGVEYTIDFDHESECLDIMNSVNEVLFNSGIEMQFVLEEENNEDGENSEFLRYSFMSSKEFIVY